MIIDPSQLDVKYSIDYPRLRDAIDHRARWTIERTFATDRTFELYDEETTGMPVSLHNAVQVAEFQVEEANSELNGAIWFAALLSRVDGLVLMDLDLFIKGFGVVITVADSPTEVFRAHDVEASEASLQLLDPTQYGTRHRSMMRYCAAVPGSVGCVISQDGDVRVMTQVRARLVIWGNVKLQLYGFESVTRGANGGSPEQD